MGILSGLLGNAGGGLIKGVSDAVDKFVQTPDERAAAELKERVLMMKPLLAQIEVNEREAQHASVFVSGWRPGVGWICAAALGYHFVVQPLLVFAVAIWAPGFEPPPPLSLGELMPILLGLLGLGGMRTAERLSGRERNALRKPT